MHAKNTHRRIGDVQMPMQAASWCSETVFGSEGYFTLAVKRVLFVALAAETIIGHRSHAPATRGGQVPGHGKLAGPLLLWGAFSHQSTVHLVATE
jgi:hypothetical protein